MMTFASTTSRVGMAGGLFLRSPPRPFKPTTQAFFDEMVQFVDVPRSQLAPSDEDLHAFKIPDALGERPAHDLAPFDLRMRPHLPVEVGGDRKGDVRHGSDYVCAHNQALRRRPPDRSLPPRRPSALHGREGVASANNGVAGHLALRESALVYLWRAQAKD